MAAQNGDDDPTQVSSVDSTYAATDQVLDGSSTVPSDLAVTTVNLQGDFTGLVAKVPTGTTKPSGGDLSVVFDTATGDLLEWSMKTAAPDLDKLGEVNSSN